MNRETYRYFNHCDPPAPEPHKRKPHKQDYWGNHPELHVTAGEAEQIKQYCREIPGHRDYWINQDGTEVYWLGVGKKTLYFALPMHQCPINTEKGYKSVCITKYTAVADDYISDCTICNATSEKIQIQRLVALTYIGSPPDGKYLVRHLNGDQGNNHFENLAWGDHQDNKDDAKWHAKTGKGRKNSVRKD